MAEGGIPAPSRLILLEEPSAQSQQWEQWLQELLMFFEAANITAGKRKRALMLYLGGLEVRNIYDTYVDTDKTFESTQALLSDHFKLQKNVSFERFKFNSNKLLHGENARSYITRLKKLAKSCDFDQYSPEDALVDHFISTCDSTTLRRKLLSQENLNLDTLLKIASTSELVESQVKVMEGESEKATEEVYALRRRNEDVCHGCGKFGHRIHAKECPAVDITCFKCQVVGHFANVCHGTRKGKVHSLEVNGDSTEESLQSLVVKGDAEYKF